MPEDREDADRRADHAGIVRLTDGILPALIAKLSTLEVGELEVREGDWHIRLRRPTSAGPGTGRRATDRAGRSHVGQATDHGAADSSRGDGHRSSRGAGSSNGSAPASLAAVGPGRSGGADGAADDDGAARGATATSPAVGIFQPGDRAVAGTRVRAGDPLGIVDMLGIPQEVQAPADGIVIGVIAEAGTAVEFGQALIHVEPAAVDRR